jgi:hypothetical protein
MEAVRDVMNQIVIQVHKEKLINVKDMEEENDVMNPIVNQVHKVKPINV